MIFTNGLSGRTGASLFQDLRCLGESRLSDEPDQWDRHYAIFARRLCHSEAAHCELTQNPKTQQ